MTDIVTQVGRYPVKDGSRVLDVDANGDFDLTLTEWCAYDLRAAIAVFSEAPDVAGPELKFARKTLDLKQKELAKVLCVSEYTVSDWERNAAPVTDTIRRLMYEILCHVEREGFEVLQQYLVERPPAPAVLEVRTGTFDCPGRTPGFAGEAPSV